MHVSTRGRERSHNSKGRVYTFILLSASIHLGDCICSQGVASELLLLDVLSLCLFWRVLLFLGVLNFASGVELVASS